MWKLRYQLAACSLIIAVVFATTVPAHLAATNPNVIRRLSTMKAANTALLMLGNMSNGRISFDESQARIIRRNLINVVRKMPKRFRRKRHDPASHAKPEIWLHWESFTTYADTAKRAASAIKVNSLPALQATLPGMLVACANCHKAFREPDR